MCEKDCVLLVEVSDAGKFLPIKNSFCIFKDTKQLYSAYGSILLSTVLRYADVFYPAFRKDFRSFVTTYWHDYPVGKKTEMLSIYRKYNPCIGFIFDTLLPELGINGIDKISFVVDMAKTKI